ncbi:MAG: hydantoinase B/oxoprolinase family protein [Rhodospirillaceae bacterium]|nr:hydantoinase B/oxoprolinase family protein [Rhodospirillaceae bacterium]
MSGFITTAVVREALASIVREMRRAMVRSSYSSIIYEGYDFSCVLIDAEGQLVAQSGEDHPFHIIPVAASVSHLLATRRAISPDDIFLHNDPYTGGTHLNDVAVVWPVFVEDQLAYFIVIRSHWADIGGMTPGSLSGGAQEILQEGLRLDNIRVPKSGESEALRLIFDNIRVNEEAIADFHAVLGICRIAEARLRRLIEKYSFDVLRQSVTELLDSSERRMRSMLLALDDGDYSYVSYLDGNDPALFPLRVAVKLTISGDNAHADFTGTSGQIAAPLNAGPAIAPTSVLTILKSYLDPAGIINSGTLRPISVFAPERTIVNARAPAPCGGLNEVRFAADAAVLGAIAQVIPERVTGDVRGTSNHTYIGGFDPVRNKSFIFYEYPSGGTGGWSVHDGNHAVRAFNEGENVSIQSTEVVEAIYPLRILQNELRSDSGGAGRFRGGCGLIRRVEVACPDARLSVLSDRNIIPPAGVNGGRSGAPNRFEVVRDGRPIEATDFPGKITNFLLRRGDVVSMQSSGGGGFGAAGERALDLIADDLADGIVVETSLAVYGARRDAQGALERDTTALRDEAHAAIGWLSNSTEIHVCVASEALALRLRLEIGQMVELVMERGPSVRAWIDEIRPGRDDSTIFLAPKLRPLFAGSVVTVRALASERPRVRAAESPAP